MNSNGVTDNDKAMKNVQIADSNEGAAPSSMLTTSIKAVHKFNSWFKGGEDTKQEEKSRCRFQSKLGR